MTQTMEMTALAGVLRGSRMFEDLTDEELGKVAALCSEHTFEAGHVIFNEGDTPDKMYIVDQGRVALDMALNFGPHVKRRATIEIVSRGEPLGWSAVTDSQALTATARCLDKTSLVGIDGEGLRRLFDEDPQLGLRIQRKTVGLVRSRLGHARDTLAHILTVVSHDLRAPVHAVQSYQQVMLGGYAGPLTQQQRDMLKRSGDRLTGLLDLIDDLLDISRIDATDLVKRPQSMAKIIENSIENIRPQAAQKQLLLSTDAPPDLPQVMAHAGRMQQLLTNLLSNAVKFIPAGSEIKVRARAIGEQVIVEVMDTGQGIPPDEQPKLFDAFYRARNTAPGGIGLGLSIAKKIVEAHNGRIWVESPYPESVKGSKFTFTLPRVDEKAGGKDTEGDANESRN